MTDETGKHKYRWTILILCVTCFCFTFVTRFTWPPLISVVASDLKLTMAQAGSYMSAFYIGYIITQIPAGILADRFGVRMVLGASLILEGVATSSLSLIGDFQTGFILRIIAGLGAGAVFASTARALVEWFPPSERGMAFGILFASPSGGILLSNFLAPSLNQMFGWHGAFMSVGTLTFAAGILVYFFMRSNADPLEEKDNFIVGLKFIFGHKKLMLVAMTGFCLMWVELGMATWANAYIKTIGFTVKEAGQVMMWYGVGGILSPLLSGYISDRIGNRRGIIVLALLLTIPATIVFGQMKSISTLVAIGFFNGFISYLANPQLTTLISNYAGQKWAATANGVANFIFQIASLISPLVAGGAIDLTGNFGMVWWILAAGPLVGIFLILTVGSEKKSQLVESVSKTSI